MGLGDAQGSTGVGTSLLPGPDPTGSSRAPPDFMEPGFRP